jgi:hypothetical protein
VSGVNRLPCKIAYYMPDSRVRNYRDIFFNGSNKGRDLHKSLKLLLKESEKGLSLFLDLRLKSSNLETAESSLSKIMQVMNLAYTAWFNRKNGKVGHLWQDRFKSAVVERDSYLLECGRYVERNPLRAGMVKDLKEYLWSSYRGYAYGKTDGVTDKHEIYDAMRRESGVRERAYREYVVVLHIILT